MLLPPLLLLLLCCYAMLLLLLQLLLLLLAAAVPHRVADGKICCWFIASDSSVLFLSIQTLFIFNVHLGSDVAFAASICLQYVLDNCGCARNQGGRQHAAAKPPLYLAYITGLRGPPIPIHVPWTAVSTALHHCSTYVRFGDD